jgi:hypothetical protein
MACVAWLRDLFRYSFYAGPVVCLLVDLLAWPVRCALQRVRIGEIRVELSARGRAGLALPAGRVEQFAELRLRLGRDCQVATTSASEQLQTFDELLRRLDERPRCLARLGLRLFRFDFFLADGGA